jgi:hypothetical protein
MDKQKLSKLASLNNEQANKFLLDFAVTKKAEIEKLGTNDEIIIALDYFNAFFYRVPKVVLEICTYLLYKAEPIEAKIVLGGIKGDDWKKVQIKSLELLKNIRYYELKETVKIAFDFASHEDSGIRSTALKLVEEISEYNYQAMPHVGLTPQKSVFEYITKNLLNGDFEKNFNSIKVAIENMLGTSADATIMTAPDAITFQKRDLNGNDDLLSLRKNIIDLIFSIYRKNEKSAIRSAVVQLLAHACQFPMNSPRSSPICLAIMANREYVISELDKVMFTPQGKLKASLSFCLEIEHLLYWHFIFHKQQDDIARPLYEKITKDVLYGKFSRFVHDDSLKYAIGSGEQEKQNRIDVTEYVTTVSDITLSKVEKELNLFATEVDVIGEWKFRNLQALLERLGAEKSELALNLLRDAITANKPLSNQMFLAFLLRGIRISGKYEIWDKAVSLIIKIKNPNFIGSIPASLHVYAVVFSEPVLRKEDLVILTNLANRSGSFEFLKTGKQPLNINYATMNALRAVYSLNPKKIEDLIVAEIKSGSNFLENYLNTLSIYAGRENGIDFDGWSDKNKKFLAGKIIEVPVIDWHIDSLINNLYSDPIDIVKIFITRIKKGAKLRKSISDYFDRSNRYDAVPFHMNDHLVEYVVTHKDYIKIVPEIIKASKSKEGSTRKFDLAKLNQHFRVSAYSILEALTAGQKVTDKILKEAISMIYDFEGIGVGLAVKLAGYTSNEKILKEIGGMLHNTGVVSGQYGIADFYRSQWAELEKYRDDANANIRKFVELSVPPLKYLDERARTEADQDKEKRRIDFETNS